MKMEDVYNYFGKSWATMARKLCLSPNTYQYWRKIGYIPHTMQGYIESVTKGELKADPKNGEVSKWKKN